MLQIMNSPLASYFDGTAIDSPKDLQNVYLLDAYEAIEIWNLHINPHAKGLYDLPNDSWILEVSWKSIGNWIDAYNGKLDHAEVPKQIAAISNWPSNKQLLLIQNRKTIISLTFELFSKYWDSLLAACDDGPLLMPNESGPDAVFRFLPLGNIMHAST